MPQFDWDQGLDFEATRALLAERMRATRPECPPDILPKKRLTHYSVLITQLANGSRVSEAFEAVLSWATRGAASREYEIRVRKRRPKCLCGHIKANDRGTDTGHALANGVRGKCKVRVCDCKSYRADPEDIEKRLMVIPPECLAEDVAFLKEAFERGLSLDGTKMFALRELGFNTHSLRYSLISNLSEKVAPQVIAKLTHQKSLDLIVKYTQQKKADATLREVVG